MPKQVVIALSKHYNSNVVGDVASFLPDTAAHILKNNGGEKLADLEDGEVLDVEEWRKTGKKVVVKASSPVQEATTAKQLAAAQARIAELEEGRRRQEVADPRTSVR